MVELVLRRKYYPKLKTPKTSNIITGQIYMSQEDEMDVALRRRLLTNWQFPRCNLSNAPPPSSHTPPPTRGSAEMPIAIKINGFDVRSPIDNFSEIAGWTNFR